MKYAWMDTYLLDKAGVTKDLKEEWNWIRYQIGGKMFAAICLGEDGNPWNSIKPDGEVPDDLLKDMLDKSYRLVLGGFSKKKQQEIIMNAKAVTNGQSIQERLTDCGKGSRNMGFDYKKEYKEFYMPKNKPGIIKVPTMNYIAVRGKGNPNEEGSEYKESIGLLYAIAFTIKMSKKGNRQIEGYFDYVVPPLEGFWWQENQTEIDFAHKEKFRFISVIRLPDFVKKEDVDWAKEEAARKKKQDFSKVEFLAYQEGLCVQCMHIGPYDAEPETIQKMHDFIAAEGYEPDMTEHRLHHEIYLSDARRTAKERLKTVIRHPIKKIL